MFNLFKPKKDAALIGEFCGHIFQDFMVASTPTIADQIDKLVSVGASKEPIVPEFAIFSAFQGWVGIAAALQSRQITEEQHGRMILAYWQELERLSRTMRVEDTGSMSYPTVWEWMKSRLDRYVVVITTSDPTKCNLALIEHFCDFSFDAVPNIEIKQWLKTTYEVGSLTVLETISKVRVV